MANKSAKEQMYGREELGRLLQQARPAFTGSDAEFAAVAFSLPTLKYLAARGSAMHQREQRLDRIAPSTGPKPLTQDQIIMAARASGRRDYRPGFFDSGNQRP